MPDSSANGDFSGDFSSNSSADPGFRRWLKLRTDSSGRIFFRPVNLAIAMSAMANI